MSTIVAVPAAAELAATATAQRPAAPPRDSIEPPGRPVADARRADVRDGRAPAAGGDFATALADEMAPEQGAAPAVPAAVPTRPPGDEDGDDAPPTGNGLPPWLVGLPPATAPASALPAGGALAAAEPAMRPSVAGEPGVGAAAQPSTVSSLIAADAAGSVAGGPLAGPEPPPAAAAASGASPVVQADDRPTGLPELLPPPTGRALPAQAHAAAPSPAAPALEHAAGSTATAAATAPGDGASAVASESLPAWAQALGRLSPRPATGEGAAASTATERRLATGATAATAAIAVTSPASGVEAPFAPLLPHAVRAALAADGESAPDLATAAPSSPSLAPPTPATPSSASASNAGAPVLQVAVPVGAPDWDRQIGERVGVLVDQGLTNAQLKLSPAHLGPLEIRISVQDDRANVWFGTHSHATREALEAAAPRLRDLLGAQGFANVGVSVDLQQQTARQNAPATRYEPEFSFAAGSGAAVDSPRAASPVSARTAERSRLDAFA